MKRLVLLLTLLAACADADAGSGAGAGRNGDPSDLGHDEPLHDCSAGDTCTVQGCVDGVAWSCLYEMPCAFQSVDDCAAAGAVCLEGADGGVCVAPGCGDGKLQDGEVCDDGLANGTFTACLDDCSGSTSTLDQRVEAAGVDREVIEAPAGFVLTQTFVATRSGRLGFLRTDAAVAATVFVDSRWGDSYTSWAVGARNVRTIDGIEVAEYVFDEPVGIMAGGSYQFRLFCGNEEPCRLPVVRGDRYEEGALVAVRWGENEVPAPTLPPDADLPFENWVVEGEIPCPPGTQYNCVTGCGAQGVPAECIEGTSVCPEGTFSDAGC